MKVYVLDKNTFSNKFRNNEDKREDLCVPIEVLEEACLNDIEINKLKQKLIRVLKPSKEYFSNLKNLMRDHGDNFRLIDLFSGKGTADVAIIAHVLTEIRKPNSLFKEEFIIFTKDLELIKVASQYGISSVSELD